MQGKGASGIREVTKFVEDEKSCCFLFSALLGNSRLTQRVQTLTTARQTIPGAPPGSCAVAFGKTAGDKWAGQLSHPGKSCRGWLGTGQGKNLCRKHKS